MHSSIEPLKCFDWLPLNAAPPVESPDDFSAFLGLFDDPMNYRFFYYNRQQSEPLDPRLASGKPGQKPRHSTLNPHAEDFHPGQTSKDARTMFLTFFKGFPLSREEILEFFTSNWGYHVGQDVVVEQTGPGRNPQFGRVVFTTSL
ncbi:hypothetical protein SLEP1_g8927 [Rubroshorea leprosula]|uniref:Uncharacterized protein n=1 Tax=Rubroshorea leprosula TaxID=152421 RepID=A0AAV5IE93_9ROSI|nr:hypothetical protein SLEP1_g8927 [Rubroshorea leprosula]